MKKATVIILFIVALSILFAIVAVAHFFKYLSYPRDKTGIIKAQRVYCDEDFFQADDRDFLYEPGSTVELLFPTASAELCYSFDVVGVEHFDTSFDPEKGYTIQFEMPNSYVSVYYYLEGPFAGIAISLDENPSTGFQWTYKASPDTMLSLVEDRYESDPYNGEEPVVGLGGVHYWKFKILKSGTVEITFQLLRGDELLDTVTYKYKCDSTDGSFEELR